MTGRLKSVEGIMKPPSYNDSDEQIATEQVSQEQGERNVAMAVCVQLAGRAIIRVVTRCEEAQDNCNLGLFPYFNAFFLLFTHFVIYLCMTKI